MKKKIIITIRVSHSLAELSRMMVHVKVMRKEDPEQLNLVK